VKNSPISGLTDTELIERICLNDDQALFAEIVRRYKGKIASTIYGMLGRTEGAEDIGQEVFIRFYRSVKNFRGDSSLGTYLTRIAINLSLNEIKKRKIKRFFSLENLQDNGIEIADNNEDRVYDDRKEIILKAVNRLSEKHRAVVVLRLLDEYSTEETAKILNLPVGTVLSRLARAQMKLREFLIPFVQEYNI